MMATTPVETSLAVLELAISERFELVREMFAPHLRPMVTPEAIQAAWSAELGRRGPVASTEYEPAQHVDPAVIADIASWLRTFVDESGVSMKGSAR